MKKLLIKGLMVLAVFYVSIMLYATRGATIRIETPVPSQDYVVRCTWTSSFMVLHGGRSIIDERLAVISSDEDFSCGVSLTAALLNGTDSLSIMHPIYIGDGTQNYEKNSVQHIVYNKTKLDVLDQLKAKFEAGEWADRLNPGAEYARNLVGCGFPHQYFDYYSEVKKVDKEHFKKLYNEPMLECMKRTFAINKKYRPGASSLMPTADEWMERMWEAESWKNY